MTAVTSGRPQDSPCDLTWEVEVTRVGETMATVWERSYHQDRDAKLLK